MKHLLAIAIAFITALVSTNAIAMQSFPADTDSFLTDEDVDLFYKQGYLLKKSCFSLEEMLQLSKTVNNVIDTALEEIHTSKEALYSNQEQMLFLNGSRVVFKRPTDENTSLVRVNGVSGIQPSLLHVLRSEKMIRTFFKLLNTPDLEHLISQLHPKLPGDGVAYPKHKDILFRKQMDPKWQDVTSNGSYAVCIIPVDPMSQENGGLWIDRNNYPEPKELEEDRIWIEAEPGDMLFMHPYLFHGSGANLSKNASRKTLLTGFCTYGANHKPYPGAHVNTRLTLLENGTISEESAPWGDQPILSASNH